MNKDTKENAEKIPVDLEARLEKRLDYDGLPRILARNVHSKPHLLKILVENPVEGHDTEKAQQLLRTERNRDNRF